MSMSPLRWKNDLARITSTIRTVILCRKLMGSYAGVLILAARYETSPGVTKRSKRIWTLNGLRLHGSLVCSSPHMLQVPLGVDSIGRAVIGPNAWTERISLFRSQEGVWHSS